MRRSTGSTRINAGGHADLQKILAATPDPHPTVLVQVYLDAWSMREGWLIDADNQWIWRFHRDEKAWLKDPKVFIDRGRKMPDGPPLLKERRYLRKDAADQLWRSLQSQGWKRLNKPAWGEAVEV